MNRPALPKPPAFALKRRALTATSLELVELSYFDAAQPLPLVLRPRVAGLELCAWALAQREWLEAQLLEHGALLLRGFSGTGVTEFAALLAGLYGPPLAYHERSSPRSQVQGNIYTSTDYPPDQHIFLHNENSYQEHWPLRLGFSCQVAPLSGGETPLADTRRVFARLPEALRQRFAERGWQYVRNLGGAFGLAWQTVFQTTDRAVVEEHCRANGVTVEWLAGDRLRTRAVRPALAQHPQTGAWVWFNHATFFHVTTLEPAVRAALLELLPEAELPSNTYYGDGSPIEADTLDTLRAAYAAERVKFSWQPGDALLLDNLLVAHGRAPYSGPRQIVVGMAQPYSWAELQRATEPKKQV